MKQKKKIGSQNGTVSGKKRGPGIVFKSISGIVLLLVVFSVIVSIIGYNGFTDALLTQYSEGAFLTAEYAAAMVDGEKMDEFAERGPDSPTYQDTWNQLDKLCNNTGATFIYIIRPDLSDYRHITFLFSTINHNSDFTVFDFGYVRETTNDEYREKYRKLYEGTSGQELVLRDRGYIETQPHITAMVPIRDQLGKTTAILCVQRQMDVMTTTRKKYVNRVITVLIILAVLVIIIQGFYLHRVCLLPVKKITSEASRFSKENTAAAEKLTKTIHNRDEIGVLAQSIDQMEERIVKYVDDLTKITAEKQRIRTELSLATRIQADMLPNIFPPFPGRREFDLFASMDPAKEVGGDFYDFFLIDDDHLCLVMADVSGKGIPAALFMMASKIILANFAKMGKAPCEILQEANHAICTHNREDMFITVWLGILELSTGRLTAANAGHEDPVIRQPGQPFELFKVRHDFVLGGMDGLRFRENEIRLQPGSRLFLYTDGVPEATNHRNELFGLDRMVQALNEHPDDSPKEIMNHVRNAVDDFVSEAEQFDDLTMLCLSYNGTEPHPGKEDSL